MVSCLRVASVFILLMPYGLCAAQGIVDLIKSPGYPESIEAKNLPADFIAVTLKTGGGDASSTMMELSLMGMMYSSRSGSDEKSRSELYDYSQASWTNGNTIKTDVGDFLVTYKLATEASMLGNPNPTVPQGKLRLNLIRKDTIIGIAPRSDLTRERLAELFSPPVQEARATQASKSTALSNLKQMTLGLIMYSTDSDDVLPYVQDSRSAFAVIQPYVKNATLSQSLNPGSRILMNMAVAGVAQTSLDNPSQVVLIYDEKPWPDGTWLVAFCDGHAVALDEHDWRQAEKTLHLKLKHTGKPLPPNYWKSLYPGS